jgi:hypothetical protein
VRLVETLTVSLDAGPAIEEAERWRSQIERGEVASSPGPGALFNLK